MGRVDKTEENIVDEKSHLREADINIIASTSWDDFIFDNTGFMDFEDEELQSEQKEEESGGSKDLFQEAEKAYSLVDNKILDFIKNFVDNQDAAAKQKKKLKTVFFWFTMVSFAFIVVTPIICLIVMMFLKVKNYYIIFGAIVASLVEVLTTVIVLPGIVAEYLFNKEEENANIKIVELMQKYSETMHGYDTNL